MFLKVVAVVTLFTSMLGATDIFSVRSFINPKTKAKVPITGQLFGAGSPQIWVVEEAPRKNDKCAIPLLAAKPGKVNDKIAQIVGPNLDKASVVPPPLPACKGWQ
jgi:hypothetical protein